MLVAVVVAHILGIQQERVDLVEAVMEQITIRLVAMELLILVEVRVAVAVKAQAQREGQAALA